MSRNRYDKVRCLGKGSFGIAWMVVSHQSGRSYVIKEMDLSPNLSPKDKERIDNEVNIIRSCCHLNIIKYKDFFITQEPNHIPVISVVMEYAECGDLFQRIQQQREVEKTLFPESQIRNWFVQLCFALQYLHKKNIIHRDLKTQNIFISANKLLKVGDFGISKTLRHENDFATTGIGTPQYMSPEICRSQPYDYKSDIWCLGCVLYEMCALEPAFGGTFERLVNNILSGSYKPIPAKFSTSIGELVKVMLRPEPSRRPTVAQVTCRSSRDQVITQKQVHARHSKVTLMFQLLAATVVQADVIAYMDYIKDLTKSETSSTNGSESGGSQLDLRKTSASSLSSAEGQMTSTST